MTLTPEMQQQLEQLKDIHLPQVISWYPFAPGWWLLLLLLLVAIAWLSGVYFGKQRALHLHTLADLHRLPTAEPVVFAGELSALLRRVAIYCHGEGVETLSGKAWADFLCQGKAGLSPEFADFIANAPYAADTADCDLTALRQAVAPWISVQLKQHKSHKSHKSHKPQTSSGEKQ